MQAVAQTTIGRSISIPIAAAQTPLTIRISDQDSAESSEGRLPMLTPHAMPGRYGSTDLLRLPQLHTHT